MDTLKTDTGMTTRKNDVLSDEPKMSDELDHWVVRDPDICCGDPTIRGTRVGVYKAAALAVAGGINMALKSLVSLTRADIEMAIRYAEKYPDPDEGKHIVYSNPIDKRISETIFQNGKIVSKKIFKKALN